MANGNCGNACILNSIAGIGDDGMLREFNDCASGAGGAAGVGVPGLIYPIPFEIDLVAATPDTIEILPLNRGGAIPFAMRIFDDPVTGVEPVVTIDEIRNGNGDTVGIKGAAGSEISTAWPLGLFFGEAPMDAYEAGLPNLPPDIGLIDSQRSMAIDVTPGASGPVALRGVVYVVIPRTPSNTVRSSP